MIPLTKLRAGPEINCRTNRALPKIVGGLLNFARKNQVRLQETNLEQFVNRSIQSIIRPENVTVDLNVNLTDPLVFLDCDQMMQVLTNLEKNAVEAMPDGGKLTISLAEKSDDVTIAISDSGTGISKENMEKLFTPFLQQKKLEKAQDSDCHCAMAS